MIDLDRPTTYLTVRDVARLTRLAENTVRRAILDGELRAVKLRGRFRIRVDDLEDWLDQGR